MQFTSELRIFVVTNYLRTRSFQEGQQLFEQRFRDRVSPTEMTIWRNAKKYKTEGSSLNLNKDRSGNRRTKRSNEKTLIFFRRTLSMIQEYQPERMVWILVRVHFIESLNAI